MCRPLDDPPPIRISNSLHRQRSYPEHAESVFDFNGNPIQYRFPRIIYVKNTLKQPEENPVLNYALRWDEILLSLSK